MHQGERRGDINDICWLGKTAGRVLELAFTCARYVMCFRYSLLLHGLYLSIYADDFVSSPALGHRIECGWDNTEECVLAR